MELRDIPFLPQKVLDAMSEGGRVVKLNRLQQELVKNRRWEENLVISAPTASGKTLAAEIVMLNKIINFNKAALYIVPLRALAQEKYKEFKHKYSSIGISVALSMGDVDSADYWLSSYDLIVVTSEKLDSLIRHNSPFLANVGVVVIDEIHMIGDSSRGAIVEMVITHLRSLIKDVQIVGLSATISNDEELAAWLNAELIRTNERSIILKKGVYLEHKFIFENNEVIELESAKDDIIDFVYHVVNEGKQAIIFVNSKRQAEHLAKNIANALNLKEEEHKGEVRKKIADKVYHALEIPTEQCFLLRYVVERGVAFHHSGLVNEQRSEVEEAFRKRYIKIIVATPTLAMGVNLPSTYVLVKDLYRYVKGRGMTPISVLEWEQMIGRAGRPKYDNYGIGLAYVNDKFRKEDVWEKYIKGEVEPLFSKLGVEPILRFHVLGLVSVGVVKDNQQLFDYFDKTFFAYQYRSIESLRNKIIKVIHDLEDWGFLNVDKVGDIKEGGELFVSASSYFEKQLYSITSLGKRVVELYLDPWSAYIIVDFLESVEDISEKDILLLFSFLAETQPMPSVSSKEREEIWNNIINVMDESIEDYLHYTSLEIGEEEIKYALVMNAWLNEEVEKDIMERYNVSPGELRGRVEIAEWLAYAMEELLPLCVLENERRKKLKKIISETRQRIKYGVKEDVLALVKIKGVGRVKARKLREIGIKKITDLKGVDKQVLMSIMGKKWVEKYAQYI